jgi:hypothetical protein
VASDDGGTAYFEARRVCEQIQTLTTQIEFRGSVRGRRIRARMWAGTAFPALARLEAIGSSTPPLFVFTASGNVATLLLPRDNRVVRDERARAVLEAIAGIPLDAADLEGVLTGCPRISGEIEALAFGDTSLKVVIGDYKDELHLRRDHSRAPWRLVVMVRRVPDRALRWRAEFHDRVNGVPRTIRLTSLEWNGQPAQSFDVQLTLRRLQINPSLGPETFEGAGPRAGQQPLTLDELQRSGLLLTGGN